MNVNHAQSRSSSSSLPVTASQAVLILSPSLSHEAAVCKTLDLWKMKRGSIGNE